MKCFKRSFFLFTFVFLLFSVTAYGTEAGAEQFEEAFRLINKGKYLKAVALYNKIAETGETDEVRAKALLYSGSVYDLYIGQPEKSLDVFKKIYTKYPDSPAAPDAFFISGRILYQMEKYQQAYDIFKIYTGRYPKSEIRRSAEIWMNSAGVYLFDNEPHKNRRLATPVDKGIRVMLKKNAWSLVFNSQAEIRILNHKTGRAVFSGAGPVVLTRKNGTIVVNSKKTSAVECIVSTESDYLSLGGTRYRGNFRVYSKPSGLMAVNHLHIEKYLYGVVPKEMSWLWSEEALMAQAIASRTYALYIKSKQSADKLYDLSATTASQVYGGYCSERERATRAVDKTAGKVMMFDDQLVISYFHANSGGQTESSANVWGADIPYLQSISDQFSSIPETRKWTLSLSFKELETLLKKSRLKTGKIKKIKLEGRSKSGRIKAFRIISDTGQLTLTGNNFRLKVGPVELKSTWFNVKTEKGKLVFQGRGYGHGVGMSQWGAHQMALANYSHEKILKHYYRGVDIARVIYR